jgi:hypothetical protein
VFVPLLRNRTGVPGSSSQRPSRLLPSWPFWLWHRRRSHHPISPSPPPSAGQLLERTNIELSVRCMAIWVPFFGGTYPRLWSALTCPGRADLRRFADANPGVHQAGSVIRICIMPGHANSGATETEHLDFVPPTLLSTRRSNGGALNDKVWVKLRRTQPEHISSALPPTAAVGRTSEIGSFVPEAAVSRCSK